MLVFCHALDHLGAVVGETRLSLEIGDGAGDLSNSFITTGTQTDRTSCNIKVEYVMPKQIRVSATKMVI